MPRDNKRSLIQKVASQAHVTFKGCRATDNVDGGVLPEERTRLAALLSEIRASDLRITPPKKEGSLRGPGTPGAPVSYMHICETDTFSMGVFLLREGASIPLHDHPGMNGMLKVLYGKIRVRCFDKPDKPPPDSGSGGGERRRRRRRRFDPPLSSFQHADLRLSVLRSTGELTEHSGPCLLSPVRDNLHQIDAVDGPAAFLDILAPPYDPEDGRDCHYYRLLRTVGGGGGKGEEEEEDEEAWLLEIPQPEDFWCGGEPYPGPQVTI